MTPLQWCYVALGLPWGVTAVIAAASTSPPTAPPISLAAFFALVICWPFAVVVSLAGWFGAIEGGRVLHEDTASAVGRIILGYVFFSAAYLVFVGARAIWRSTFALGLPRGQRGRDQTKDPGGND